MREREREREHRKKNICDHHTKTGIARNWLTLKFMIMSGKAVAVTSHQSLGFRVGGLGFRVEDLGFGVIQGFILSRGESYSKETETGNEIKTAISCSRSGVYLSLLFWGQTSNASRAEALSSTALPT